MTAPGRDYVSRRVWVKSGALSLAVLAALALFFAFRKRVARIWFSNTAAPTPPASAPRQVGTR